MKNKKHIFIPLFVFIGACLVSLIWSVIDYTAFNKVQSYSYEVIQFDYDGASDGKDPDGNAFNAVGFLTDDVIQDGLTRSALDSKYSVETVRKCIDLSNVVPKNIIKEIESYESLVNAGKGRELTAEDYHPIRYKFSLYQELDKKLASSKLNELLDNIVKSYCEKFYLTYAKSYDNSVYDSLFTIEDYDYIYQAQAYTSKIRVLSNYANDIFNEHDDFVVEDVNFNDLVLKGDQLVSSDVFKINNHIILNALSGGKPCFIKYIMMSSLVHIASLKVAVPSCIKVCALFSHTSVPCDNPDILISSSKVVGFVSISISLTNFVPNSGTPNEPTFEFICSGVTPNAFVDVNNDIVSLSSSGIVFGFTPVKSCNILITVGSSCPSISSLSKFLSIEW